MRGLWEIKKLGNHEDDLMFIGVPVAGDGEFDFVGSNFNDVEVKLSSAKQEDASCMSDGNGGGSVLAEKKFFNPHDLGLKGINEGVEFGVNFKQTVLEGSLGRSGNDAEMFGGEAVIEGFDESEAANGSAGVDTERNHNS